MDTNLLMINRDYVTMETINGGNFLAVKKDEYDRIVFLTEVYGKSLLIPAKEMVNAVPIIEKQNRTFELSSTGGFLVAMRDIKLTTVLKNSMPGN